MDTNKLRGHVADFCAERSTSLMGGDALAAALRELVERIERLQQKASQPAPTETVTISEAQWDATQAHIRFLVNSLWEIFNEVEDGFVRGLPYSTLDAIKGLVQKATDAQIAFEAEQGA